MICLQFPGKLLLSPAALAFVLAGLPVLAHAQKNPYDPTTFTVSPPTPISTEPLTLFLSTPVPDGTTAFFGLQLNAGQPPEDNPYVASCQVTYSGGKATCNFGRVPDGAYLVHDPFATTPPGRQHPDQASLTVVGPGSSTVSALQDQYAFLIRDQSTGSGAPKGGAAAGSFTADGKGNITTGVMDVNGATGTFQALPVTGSYTLNAAGQGTITLNTSQGTVSLAVVVPASQTLSNVTNAILLALPGSLVTGGGTLVNQSGPVASYSPVNPNFGPTLNGGYVGTLAGEVNSPAVPVGGAIQFAFDPTGNVISSGQLTVNGGPVPFVSLAGVSTPVDGTTGRTTYTLSVPGQSPFSFVAYETSQQGFYYLSLAPHASNPLFAGTATQ